MAWLWFRSLFWGVEAEEEATLGKDEDENWEEVTTDGEDVELRLILVGKSGGGKSATGNTILGRREFKSVLTAKTLTLNCQKGEGIWQGTKISVVDTCAIFDSKDCDGSVCDEIRSCVKLSWPGPHALILVTQVGRFTAEDTAAAKRVRDIFGSESTRHTIVLFTCVEDLGGVPLQEYIQNSDNRDLRELIWRCGHRFCGFNNKAEGTERERQVSELMTMVQRTISQNGGQYYVSRLYSEPDLQDEDIRRLREQSELADKVKYIWESFEKIISVGRFLFSVLTDHRDAERGLPQLTTSTLAIRSSNDPEKRDL